MEHTIKEVFTAVKNCSERNFPDSTLNHYALKMVEEAKEWRDQPNDLEEIADNLFVLLAGLNKSTHSLNDLLQATLNKVEKNNNRTWVKRKDGTYKHVKDIRKEFPLGTRVKVIKYGHLIWINRKSSDYPFYMRAFQHKQPYYSDEHCDWYDLNPAIVGCVGIVDGYTHDNTELSLSGIPGKHAWYNPNQLEKI